MPRSSDEMPGWDERAAIELQGVVKEFGSERVLDGVDLVVPAGAITVLLGPSGAGKTVTIKHIVGLLEPDEGAIRVKGKDFGGISEQELYEVRRGMSVVLQGALPFSCGLFHSLSVYENVAYGLRERTRWSGEHIDRVTRDALRMVGLHEQAHRMPADLSGGEAKRTALARALALESGIVIIDDLDAGLDDVRLALLCQVIRDAREDTDATVLVTTVCAVLGGYALVHLTLAGRAIVLALLVASMFFPTRVTSLIAIFETQRALGLINTTAGLILPYVTINLALSVFIMRGIFEQLGASVNWNPGTRMVTAFKEGKEVDLRIGDRRPVSPTPARML